MRSSDKYALLVDLAKLLRKYGPETFEDLATSLSDPAFTQNLVEILRSTAKGAQRSKPRKKKGVAVTASSFRKTLETLEASDPRKAALLLWLYDGLMSKSLLHSLRDIRDFLLDNGFPPVKANSRQRAIVPFLKIFLELPLDQVESVIKNIPERSESDDRSLEAWSNIILGKEED